ncbi:MAG: hypothetical protein ABIO63_12655 [Casimicrobiaceae bacterium]
MRGLLMLLGISCLAASIGAVNAHTTSIGYVPGSTAGSVTFWTGSYSHGGGAVNEGTATLTGVSVPYNQVVNFNIPPVLVKPAGLIDGTNNFFWGPSPYPFPVSVDPVLFGGVVVWQGVQFTGLVPGTYTFSCGGTCGTTQQWQSLTTGVITVNLTGSVIGGGGGPPADIPTMSEWSLLITALMLLVLGFLALRLRR